ncbi:hypothetical protein [Aureivirga sp. CE67]|uniref:hypothetical protein n=1 Tax=Aureivirga sp. CE67 TaxID=1788983 RepID=UPI0018C9D680|nr:hypothetical protein [Aureivirga sp. CE67]
MEIIEEVELFEHLESFDDSKILKALEIIKENEEFKKSVEKRYLHFIRIRLDNPKATIFDYLKAAPTKDEIDFAIDKLQEAYDQKAISFENFSDLESKLLVDIIGAIVRDNVKLLQFISKVKRTTEAYYIADFVEEFRDKFEEAIGDQIFICTKGWYSKLCVKIYNISEINKVIFKNTDFSKANLSAGFEAFTLLLILKQNGDTKIEISQSEFPEFTKLFWMFINIPRIYLEDDSRPTLPDSILLYQRVTAYYLRNDEADFYYIEK